MAYRDVILADSPLAYWRLGEPSGTVANDELGPTDADLVNTPTLGVTGLLTGDADTAMTFTRASLEYGVATANVPVGSTTGVSLEGWCKFATLTAATIYPIVRWANTSPAAVATLQYQMSLGAWRYFYQDAGGQKNTISDAHTPTVGPTYHVVVTHDYAAELVRFYINGVLLWVEDVSANGTPIQLPAASTATIARAGSDYFDGTLDEVAIYKTILSASQILTHYVAGNPNPQLVTPTTAALVISTFAPSVAATAHQTVTPTTASLALTTFAPTVTASDHKVVTPTTAALTLTTFAPTVTATEHQTVMPGTAALTITTYAPTVAVSYFIPTHVSATIRRTGAVGGTIELSGALDGEIAA